MPRPGPAGTCPDLRRGRRYGPADLALTEDLGHRCALALDNARLYGAAQEAIRARDEFLSVAAHELKTPTTSVLGFAQLLRRRLGQGKAVDPGWVQHTLDTIDNQAHKLAQLVVQLLDVSRIEAGKLTLEPQVTDLTRLAEGVVAAARLRAGQHAFVVQTPGPTLGIVDPVRMEQVLTNLVDNAIKFSPAGSQIDVQLSQPHPGLVHLAVRDRGIGVPPEKRPHIFDRFYQAHEGDPLRRVPGMGLGLYLSRQIVELHGGRIDVESPADGGSRFVVTLPTGTDDAAPPAADGGELPERPGMRGELRPAHSRLPAQPDSRE